MQPSNRNLWTRAAAVAAALCLTAGLAAVPASADEKLERKVKIKVMTGAGTEIEEVDVSDLAVGETRWVTSRDGKDVGITREESGYRISVEGEDTFVMTPSAGPAGMRRVHVRTGEGSEKGSQVFVRKMATAGEGGGQSMVFVTDDNQAIHLDGLADTVFISGLGDLDESRRQAIVDALRGAGVDKEIRFAPSGPHGFRFLSGEGAGEGQSVEVNVEKSVTGGDGDGHKVIIIEKVVEKDE